MASPLREAAAGAGGAGAPLAVLGSSQWAEANRVGSWTWLIARCWRPSWIQRAPQLVQMAIGYRPKPMVIRADRHSGQRGIRGPLLVFLAVVVATYGREGRRLVVAALNWAVCPRCLRLRCLSWGPQSGRGGSGCAWGWPPRPWAPGSAARHPRTRPGSPRPAHGRAG